MQANESVDARVRRRLRELRTEQGLTLAQVGERANIDLSTLSRLESGKRRLALDHLPALAAALGVSADDLIGAPPPPDPRVYAQPVRRDGLTLWSLSNHGAGGLHTYKVLIDPDRSVPPAELPVHDGRDWMYVLSGRLRLLLGAADHVIDPGQAVEFTTLTPHWFGAIDGPVELLLIVGSHGERVHLHG
jgi:transcriptional regulator with XRE-family HTH domain